jgi:hypothetical protein
MRIVLSGLFATKPATYGLSNELLYAKKMVELMLMTVTIAKMYTAIRERSLDLNFDLSIVFFSIRGVGCPSNEEATALIGGIIE